jgi:hypothetical protein
MLAAAGAITNMTVDAMESVIDEAAEVDSGLNVANTKSHGWSFTWTSIPADKSQEQNSLPVSIYLQSWHVSIISSGRHSCFS